MLLEREQVDDLDKEFFDRVESQLGYSHNKENYNLIKLGIYPFKKESVEKYKAREAFRAKLHACFTDVWTLVGLSIFVISLITTVFCHELFCVISIASFFLTVCHCFIDFTPQWARTELYKYKEPVPEFVLQTALDIRKEYKCGQFYIDKLVINNTNTDDPFLVFTYQNEDYYLEVWNEPRFKQARVV